MSGAKITLRSIQGGLLTIRPADVFCVAKCGSGSVVEFLVRPEGEEPWKSSSHVLETPGEIRPLYRKALALDRKLKGWKR